MAVALLAAGDDDERERGRSAVPQPGPASTSTATPAASPAGTPTPEPPARGGRGHLAIGITEPNPAFVHPGSPVPEPFARWRDALQRMRPDLYRLVIDWPNVGADLAVPNGGCMRAIHPCAGYAGLAGQLEAVAAAQQGGGWETMVVITGTPERYAARPGGCEPADTEPRSRRLTPAGLRAYRRLIRRVRGAAAAAGARLRYWSPWNEPNHPYGLSPQRRECSAASPSAAVAPYARMAQAMLAELADGEELVLGELAGLLQAKPGYTHVTEFIRGLPRDVVCAAGVFGQHGYVGGPDPVDEVARALRRFDCPRRHEIWITETGAGAARSGAERRRSGPRACRSMRKRLLAWYEDPRVTAAFQYTLREDDRFPTGLVTVDLGAAYSTLDEWVAWGAGRSPQDRPPRSTC